MKTEIFIRMFGRGTACADRADKVEPCPNSGGSIVRRNVETGRAPSLRASEQWAQTFSSFGGAGVVHKNQNNHTKITVQTNMENLIAVFINEALPQRERLIKLKQIAIQQMSVLQQVEGRKMLK
jgi:hypothetical protein